MVVRMVVDRLPFDVWNHIFEQVLEGLVSTYAYAAQRKRLLNVSTTWRAFVKANATMWSTIFFDRDTSLLELQDGVEFSKTLPLHLVLHMHATSAVSAECLLQTLAPILCRCQSLWVHLTVSSDWEIFRTAFEDANYQNLQEVSVSFGSDARGNIARGSMSLLSPNLALTTMRLHGIPYDWASRPSFWNMTSLSIVDPGMSPSWLDFRFIATNLAALRRLCLRSVACTDIPDDPVNIIIFPSLVELDLYFGSVSPASDSLIRRCSMPNLEKLRFHADDYRHIMALVFCLTFSPTIHHLIISSTCGESFYWLLFARLPCLRKLEILSHDKAILSGIMEADMRLRLQKPRAGPACPMLDVISTSGATASNVREFFMRRAAMGVKLSKVVFTGGLIQKMMSEVDMSLLHSRVCVEEGEPYRDPSWLFLSGA